MTDREYESFKEFINKVLYDYMTIDDYDNIMRRLGSRNRVGNRYSTICHNVDGGKRNLSFDDDSRIFTCFSECNESFNLLTLVKKRFELLNEPKGIVACLKWICAEIGIKFDLSVEDVQKDNSNRYNWQNLKRYTVKNKSTENTIYDKSVLKFLDDAYYVEWGNEGISEYTQEKFGIKYYSYRQQIVIPVFDDEGNFVGTHCRNLIPEVIESGMKYYHLQMLNGAEYKFLMGSVLFGLNMNKHNIEQTKECIIFESPKSVMMYDGFTDKNNSVGIFGMNFQISKAKLLIKYGCTKFVIALDRQYESENSKEFNKYTKNVNKIVDILRPHAEQISVVWDRDKDRLLGYKDSPTDNGVENWNKLYKNREIIVDTV